jgi:regulator of Ty1 transposition protein 109
VFTMQFANSLRENTGEYTLFSIRNTKRCVSVFHKQKSNRPSFSTKTTHFCILFGEDVDQSPLKTKVPLLAVEVFTYLDFYADRIEKLVYVSKADTTGLEGSQNVNVGRFVIAYISEICQMTIAELLNDMKVHVRAHNDDGTDVTKSNNINGGGMFMSETQHHLHVLQQRAAGNVDYGTTKRLYVLATEYLRDTQHIDIDLLVGNVHTRLVMFTRSEGQYLFPESVKNAGKHVLDGSKLLKWWLRNVDGIVTGTGWEGTKKWLDVLNMDNREIARFFPSIEWKAGNVYSDVNSSEPAIYSIPLLPDDPKGRFLEHLVVEGRAKKVNCTRYWEELAIRQEFRFGAVVGLVGVSGVVKTTSNSNAQENPLQVVDASVVKQFNELVTSKDYSDKSDWSLLFDELDQLEGLKRTNIQVLSGTWVPRSHSEATNALLPVVNTLMCVRSRKRQKKS